MIKQIFIPLVVLGQNHGDLLELYSEPRWFKPKSCFAELAGCGLESGIVLAEQITSNLAIKPAKCMIYSGNSHPLLSNSLGTAAGLILASFIQSKLCHYQTIIVSGGIDNNPNQHYPMQYNGFWDEKFTAVLNLAKQSHKTPLILAEGTPLSNGQIQKLLALNIHPVLVKNLNQAIDFCSTSK